MVKFVTFLNSLEKKNEETLSVNNRKKLNKYMCNIDKDTASHIHGDLCYMYLCMKDNIQIDSNKLKLLNTYSNAFLCTLLDIGDFQDKLADVALMDKKEFEEKWKSEELQHKHEKALHKRNSQTQVSYSKFLFDSRIVNESAYNEVMSTLNALSSDVNLDKWQKILMLDIEDLKDKPSIYFYDLRVKNLNMLQKRAIVHKLTLVLNVIPEQTRQLIKTLSYDIYYSKDTNLSMQVVSQTKSNVNSDTISTISTSNNSSKSQTCPENNIVVFKYKKACCCIM